MTEASASEDLVELDLTQSQRMIWTGQRLQPNEPLYNMILAFELQGRIDVELFQRAHQRLIDNCDALRMVVVVSDQVPKQRFLKMLAYKVEVVDLTAQADPQVALAAWIEAHRQRRFDLGECLFESSLIRLADARYVWYFNQHHLSCDAWTTALLYRRMQEFYALAAAGVLDQAPMLPAFRDYVIQERLERDSAIAVRCRAFWRKKLEAAPMPSCFYRPVAAERKGETERFTCVLEPSRSARLKSAATVPPFQAFTQDLGRFQLFATALFAYLYRITGNRQLAVGTPTHNRVSPALKETPGLFIEIFPVQVEIEAGESFLTLHAKVAEATQQLLMNTAPGISGFDHNRAYDVLLNYITASFGDFNGMPSRAEWVHSGYGDRNHLLRIQVHEFDQNDSFVLHFDMNRDVFVGDEREWVIRHFLTLLDGLLDDPEQAITDVDLLSVDERDQFLAGTRVAENPERSVQTVIERFVDQVRESPEAIALSEGDFDLSYTELNLKANDIAARLRANRVGHGDRVALCLPRSIDAVVAILGVLKIGAAYVPVDPDYPADRIRFIVDDAAVRCVLTSAEIAQHLPEDLPDVIHLDGLAEISLKEGGLNPDDGPLPDDTCYLIYTSGSTGLPKGVMVNHRGLANYIDWASRYYLDGKALDFPLFSTLSFDLTVTSLFVPLLCGARLVIYLESPDHREITIQRVIEDNRVDAIKLTPAHLALLQTMDLSSSRVRKLIVGGEDLKTDLVRAISRRFGRHVEIYNEYGPTEGTVACMIYRHDPAMDRESSVPIGRPIDGLRIYLLDAQLAAVPTGVVGEIFIAGLGVADGYLNAVEMTAQCFLDDPFVVGHKMYTTGDLGRWGADGEMRYLGRRDQQVKINGIRVELAEIEAALLAQPGVTACVVSAEERNDPARDADGENFCRECGISGRHPEARLDEQQVCGICRSYAEAPDKAHGYFRSIEELQAIIDKAKSEQTGTYDSIALLSGGKDSSYALARLVEMGLRPLAFTLDNGFISDGAKANIRRLTDSLGLDLHIGTTEVMNDIFVDSLNRHSNVCNGCFKTIYTLSMNLARKLGVRIITTGLSRGQIFETRLADMFRHNIFDPDEIDRTIVAARKAYHRQDDVVARKLDTQIFEDDAVFEEIQFVDFYRYSSASLDEIYEYLESQTGWIRPADTGRSTNCLINEAGIYVHKAEQGFHNYSLPYSWDVRLGHKERDAAREELEDNIDVANVKRILAEIGYQGDAAAAVITHDKRLLAYYVADRDIPVSELRAGLSERLPATLVPALIKRLEALPLTANGKVDRAALPAIESSRDTLALDYVAPSGAVEDRLAAIWREVIGLDRIGRSDNFFDLGGDSILNIQIVGQATKAGLAITPQQIFDYPTIAELAAVVGQLDIVEAEQGVVTGPSLLTPIQCRFFESFADLPQRCSQSVLLSIPDAFDADILEQALPHLLRQHDGLRSRFVREGDDWRQEILGNETSEGEPRLQRVDLTSMTEKEYDQAIDVTKAGLQASFNLGAGGLVRGACFSVADGEDLLLLVVHHLVIDGVSWWILLEDLKSCCERLVTGGPVRLPAKSTSVPGWARALDDYAQSRSLHDEVDYWAGSAAVKQEFPVDFADAPSNDRSMVAKISASLGAEETAQLLHEVPAVYSTQVTDLLLTALAQSVSAWTGQSSLTVDLEGHGRESVVPGTDLLRTLGWFTTIYPVRLSCEAGGDPGRALMAIKEQLRAVPHRGIGYGALRYLCRTPGVAGRLREQPNRQMLFNYLGQSEQAPPRSGDFRLVRPIMADYGDQGPRPYLIEINAVVFAGQLQVDWTYSSQCHRRSTIEALAEGFTAALRSLIAHCLSVDHGGLSPSDFPQAGLDQDGLDDLLAEFGDEL